MEEERLSYRYAAFQDASTVHGLSLVAEKAVRHGERGLSKSTNRDCGAMYGEVRDPRLFTGSKPFLTTLGETMMH